MTALPQGIRTDELGIYQRELAFYKSIGADAPEHAARGWVIRMRADAAGRTDRMDTSATRRDDTRTDEVTDADRNLLEAAVLARHCDRGAFAGAEAARALRKELQGYLQASKLTSLRVRAETVLAAHGQRFDGSPVPVPQAGSYSHTDDGRMVRWPDSYPSEFAARQRLAGAGVNHAPMDTAGVHGAITMLLANDDDDDDDDERTDSTDATANPWLGRGLAEYTTGRAPLELATTRSPATKRKRR